MIVGILSDTHGKADAFHKGLDTLRQAGAEFFIHCGDVGPEQMLDALAGLPAVFVWGNNDWDRLELARYAKSIDVTCGGDLYQFELDGRQLAVTHGDDDRTIAGLLQSQSVDYLFTGHTHRPHDRRQLRTRWINPGALYRARPKTVAVLDLSIGRLNFIDVDC